MDAKLNVTIFGKQGAEKWVRHAYNIPAHVGCWQPYRVIIQRDALSETAFYTVREFRQWLRSHNYKVKLDPHHRTGYKVAWVARFGQVA